MATQAQARNAKIPAREMLQTLGASVLSVGVKYDEEAGEWYVRAVIAEDIPEHIKKQMLHRTIPIAVVPSKKWSQAYANH